MSDVPHPSPADDGETILRREARTGTNWIAVVRLPDGTEIPCNVKDVSPSGARLGIPGTVELPETFLLKVVGRDFICQVRLAWRRNHYAGVRIERIGKLAGKQEATARPGDKPTADYTSLGPRKSRISSF